VTQCRLPNHSSVFTDELQAISLALDFIENSRQDQFLIFSDSLSSLQAIQNHHFDVPLTRNILERCHNLQTTNKSVSFRWIPSHVGIRGNERADSAAKAALGLPESAIQIPHTDLRQKVNSHFLNKWQTNWNNTLFNKLQSIKPHLGETKLANIVNRREEVVLHRARVGHTHLTHSYLLRGEDVPECIPCQCLLTVEHVLILCVDLSLTRIKYYSVTSIKQLFDTVDPRKIVSFLKEIQLYEKL
jgi:kelch-like protein 2/3